MSLLFQFSGKNLGCPKFFLPLLIFCSSLHAQTDRLQFKHLTIDDGLSQGLISCILQDRKGYMWFGTKDGLNRYDGYRFKVFRHDPADSTSLSQSAINTLYEDKTGRLWVGTEEMLNLFDPRTEKFQRVSFRQERDNTGTVNQDAITAIGETHAGTLWIGTKEGLVRFDAANKSFTRYTHEQGNSSSLSSSWILSVLVDRTGVLWVGTDAGLNQLAPKEESGTNLHSGSNRQVEFTRFAGENQEGHGLSANRIVSLYEDPDGVVWIGTHFGLIRCNPRDRAAGKFRVFPHEGGFLAGDWRQRITAICMDLQGRLWLATPGGLAIFDPHLEQYRYLTHDPHNPHGLNFTSIHQVYHDRSGKIWVGTSGKGLNVYDQHARPFKYYTGPPDKTPFRTNFSVGPLLEDAAGALWFSLGNRLYRMNRSTEEIRELQLQATSHGRVNSMILDRRNDIWIATERGLYHYAPNRQKISHFIPDPAKANSVQHLAIWCVYEDKAGNIWCTNADQLSRWDQARGRFFHYAMRLGEAPMITDICETRPGLFWLGWNQGLARFDPENAGTKVYRNAPDDAFSLSHNHVTSILPDPLAPERILWVGTGGGGLNRFDMVTEKFSRFTEKDGLPNNHVYGILADDSGNLWMSTNRGLSRFNPRQPGPQAFRNYDTSDRLQSYEFNTNSYHKGRGGEMFFGGVNGINAFFPVEIKENPHAPPVVFTDFLLLNRSLPFNQPGSPLKQPLEETEEITLTYRDNIFALEFAALDFTEPEKNRYAYKMEGFQNDWVDAGTNRLATFTNLDPGAYVFRVRGANNDGVWNEEGAAIKITITPPWWQTWWAYALYAILLTTVLNGLRLYELNRLRLKSRLKLEQVEAEKLKELDALKSRFFANISHEFRTPLTLILGPVEQMRAKIADEEFKQKLDLVRSNAQRLLRLITQLLDLSRLESGKMQLKAGPGDLASFLRNLVMSFSSLAERKSIALQFSAGEKELATWFDRDVVEKVFVNLLSNAFKFTPEGGKISVLMEKSDTIETESGRAGEWEMGRRDRRIFPVSPSPAHPRWLSSREFVQITVRDTGIGIPTDQLLRVFDRFHQVDSSMTREQEGSGIGLALVKELVELHHGDIRVRSEEGWGTTFVILLPLGKEHLKPEEIIETSEPSPLIREPLPATVDAKVEAHVSSFERPASGDREIILIIEDNAELRAYLREYLEPAYQIIEAQDGGEGLEKAMATIPDLVISDVMMPKLSGYQLCQTLKTNERTSHIPVILLTAKAAAEEKIAGLETGADDYLTKPFEARELAARVRNLIELRRTLRQRFSHVTVIRPAEVSAVSLDQAFLQRVTNTIEDHLGDEIFGLEALAGAMHMSVSQVNRKLKALIDQTGGELIRSLRMQRAADLLAQSAGTIAEIAHQVGFSDQAHFARSFKKQFGCAPSEFRHNVERR